MIKLYVLSKVMAEGIGSFDDDTLVMSIGSSGTELANLRGRNVFYFQTNDDITMLKETADCIAEVAFNHMSKGTWVIHCEAGVSRSPGVAIALAHHVKLDPDIYKLEKMYSYHNRHVKLLVQESMRKKIADSATIWKD